MAYQAWTWEATAASIRGRLIFIAGVTQPVSIDQGSDVITIMRMVSHSGRCRFTSFRKRLVHLHRARVFHQFHHGVSGGLADARYDREFEHRVRIEQVLDRCGVQVLALGGLELFFAADGDPQRAIVAARSQIACAEKPLSLELSAVSSDSL